MGREAFEIKGDCFLDVFFGLLEIASLTMASRQRRHMSDKAAFWSLFVENCIGKLRYGFLHDFILDDLAGRYFGLTPASATQRKPMSADLKAAGMLASCTLTLVGNCR